MPILPPRPCGVCGVPVSGKPALCDKHKKVDREPNRVHEQQRTGKEPWRAWYHRLPWRSRDGKYGLRADTLRKHPVCNICHRVASTIADHIKAHKGLWALFVDEKNLQGICKKCHDEKTARENS